MAFNQGNFLKFARSALLATSALYAYPKLNDSFKQEFKQYPFMMQRLFKSQQAQALHPDTENTNIYVWGEGYQVDASQEFSNFSPKKIKQFAGKDTPNIKDIAFGWFHEAYIDTDGNLFVCAKAKITSVKVKEIPDG